MQDNYQLSHYFYPIVCKCFMRESDCKIFKYDDINKLESSIEITMKNNTIDTTPVISDHAI